MNSEYRTPRALINEILEWCNVTKMNESSRYALCKLLYSAIQSDKIAFISVVQEYLGLLAGSPEGRVYVSTGDVRHWVDSLRYGRSFGLVPWACGVKREDIGRLDRRGGPHWSNLYYAVANQFISVDNVVEVIPPLNLYNVREHGIIGLGVVVAAEVNPYKKLWSREACPPGSDEPCYSLRWYTLPLMLSVDDEMLQRNRIRVIGVIGEVSRKGRRNCAQSLGEDAGKLVNVLLENLENGTLRDYVELAYNYLRESLVSAVGGAHETDRGLIPNSKVEHVLSPWESILGDLGSVVKRITERLLSSGVYIDRNLVEVFVALVAHSNVLLVGPPGTGKTLLASILADVVNARLVPLTGHAGLTRVDLIGGPVLHGGNVAWRSGVLLRALYYVARGERVLLLLDEVNRMDVDKVFGEFFTIFSSPSPRGWNLRVVCNAICDEAMSYADLDEPAKLVCKSCMDREEFEDKVRSGLRVVATMNTVDFATVFNVGEAFGRRFFKIRVLPSIDENVIRREVEVAANYARSTFDVDVDEEVVRSLVSLLKHLRKDASSSDFVTPLPVGPAMVAGVMEAAAPIAVANGSRTIRMEHVCRALDTLVPVNALLDREWMEKWTGAVWNSCRAKMST
ncbi:cyclic nucleotide-binding protein [Pyrolobus fumarii 1A]|uniref:Cyclic nucleotide-binding protein n=1 Tax=Pyrolobus fumarii (strain DSM 11204 / 1A) TaxID=694429 RepID=G0EFU8_PYRF1|nr:MoxR family ATPase [Pyrolobus fumarii]AEM39049.1 cyclic nucleotide-binding protein [Pyrolobus fumarii 1A]